MTNVIDTVLVQLRHSAVGNQFEISVKLLTKFYSSHLILPCGNDEKREEKYRLAKDLISDSQLDILFHKRAHSWPRSTKAVTPLLVPRDGNSLCHSISVLICGVVDQNAFFRRCLYSTCMAHLFHSSPLCYRWTTFITKIFEELERDYSDDALTREWNQICFSSTTEPTKASSRFRDFPTIYSPLQQFHIFVMSQICRRVIVVASLEEGGFKPSIYLPVTIPVSECVKSPLYIAHHRNHFAPLVFVEERDAGNKIRDLCFPIVDSKFVLYEFPYLFDNEDGIELLKKYARVTKFGYTTSHNFNELPALRIPEPEFRTLTGCIETGVDPNEVLQTCFDGLGRSFSPEDVHDIWQFSIDLKDKLNEDLSSPSVFSGDAQPMSSGMQPESEAEDSESSENDEIQKGNGIAHNSNSFHKTSIETSSKKMEPDCVYMQTGNSRCDNISNTSYEQKKTFEQSIKLPSSSSRVNASGANNCTIEEEEICTNPYEEKKVPDKSLILDDTDSQNRLNDCLRNSFSTSAQFDIRETSDLRSDGASCREMQNGNERSYSGGYRMTTYSSNHVVLTDPHKVPFFVFKLEFGEDSVIFRLEKEGLNENDKVKLSLPSLNKLQVNFERTIENRLEMKLTKPNSNLRLDVTLPENVICDRTSASATAEALVLVPGDYESPFFDFTNNPDKCRTAGCMNRAVKQYRNLCGSCHSAWSEMLRRSEESSSFSYYDSVSSIESRANDGGCRNKNCRREGVTEFYGFCQECFEMPGL